MRYIKIFSIFILALFLATVAHAQYCNFFAMSQGMVLGYQNLDSKGKVTSKSQTTCLDVSTDSTGTIIYKVKTVISDDKNANHVSREYKMKCKDGKFNMDFGTFIDPETMKEFDNMAISVDTKDMTYPEFLSAGQTLSDAKITISKTSEGTAIAVTKIYTVTVTNRKVVSSESVTVPAGTFDCYKITYDMEIKMVTSEKYTVAEYISVGVGRVKTESYDKKSKLKSSSLLVELKK